MKKDLHYSSAGELGQLLCQGKISATELLDEQLTQIKRFNPALNAKGISRHLLVFNPVKDIWRALARWRGQLTILFWGCS